MKELLLGLGSLCLPLDNVFSHSPSYSIIVACLRGSVHVTPHPCPRACEDAAVREKQTALKSRDPLEASDGKRGARGRGKGAGQALITSYYHVVLYYVILFNAIVWYTYCDTLLYYAQLHFMMLYYIMFCHIKSSYVVLRYVVLCCAASCHVVVLRHVVLYRVIRSLRKPRTFQKL